MSRNFNIHSPEGVLKIKTKRIRKKEGEGNRNLCNYEVSSVAFLLPSHIRFPWFSFTRSRVHMHYIRVHGSPWVRKDGGYPDVTCFARRRSLLLLQLLRANGSTYCYEVQSAISGFAPLPTSPILTFFRHSFFSRGTSLSPLHTVNVNAFKRPG